METEEEFTKKCSSLIANSFSALCLAIGHKLNLFDYVNAETPRSSQDIANAAGYRERYVREWLKSMVAADIIEVNETGDKFWLPSHRRGALSNDNQSLSILSYLPRLAVVFDQITYCFSPGGPAGTPYSAYEDFHKFEAEYSDRYFLSHLIDKFIPATPGLVDKLKSGIVCLDIGCGRGTPSFLLAKSYPNSTFFGVDFCENAVNFAQKKARESCLTNVQYAAYDAAKLPLEWSNKFDYVTAFDSIHDQAHPDLVLKEIYRVLKPGGRFSMVDVNGETNVADNKTLQGREFYYAVSLFHCMPVSLYFPGGIGLGTLWGKQKALEMLTEVGFVDIVFKVDEMSQENYHCLSKKPTVM